MFDKPLPPGEKISGRIHLIRETQGVEESNFDLSVVENGTFINNIELLPQFGYQEGYELSDRHEREKRGLEDKPRANKLEDTRFYRQNFFGVDGDFIDFEATVSTSGQQMALVPGYLQRQWRENGRNFFHYKMDSPMVNFYSILSGRFEVDRQKHKA